MIGPALELVGAVLVGAVAVALDLGARESAPASPTVHYRAEPCLLVEVVDDDGSLAAWASRSGVLPARSPTRSGEVTTHYFAVADALAVRKHLALVGEPFERSRRFGRPDYRRG